MVLHFVCELRGTFLLPQRSLASLGVTYCGVRKTSRPAYRGGTPRRSCRLPERRCARARPEPRLQGDALLVGRQPIEARAVQRGEGLQPVERAFLGEDLGIDLHRHRRVEDAGAAAGAFLGVGGVRRGVGAEEELRAARGRGAPQRQAMLLALGDRQAIEVRTDAALEDGIAVVAQVMRRDRAAHARADGLDEGHAFAGRDVLQHDLQPLMPPEQRRQHLVEEHRLAVEDVDVGIGHLAMDQERHAGLLHRLEAAGDLVHRGDAVRRVGRGMRGIELGRDPHALAACRAPARPDRRRRSGSRSSAARTSARPEPLCGFVAIGRGLGDPGHRRHQVGHDDGAGELARGMHGAGLPASARRADGRASRRDGGSMSEVGRGMMRFLRLLPGGLQC